MKRRRRSAFVTTLTLLIAFQSTQCRLSPAEAVRSPELYLVDRAEHPAQVGRLATCEVAPMVDHRRREFDRGASRRARGNPQHKPAKVGSRPAVERARKLVPWLRRSLLRADVAVSASAPLHAQTAEQLPILG
ncbi:MAG: hypothetical protein LC797_18500 [Chloroflexi bacterium]|nr:hypothetical protein [Chloroflexota bacterium]